MAVENPGDGELSPELLTQCITEAALDRKALDLVVVDLRGRASYTDTLVIASGTSDRHVQGIAQHIVDRLKERGARALGCEGISGGQWALIDFGDVVVHVFHQFTRSVYKLEELWAGAPQQRVDEPTDPAPTTNPTDAAEPA